MEPLSFDVMDRLRVCFESREYQIRHEHCAGYVRMVDGTERYFKIVNGLCTPAEVRQLFNCWGIAQVILKRVPEAVYINYVNFESNGFRL
jgi:hypothetical protein